MYSSMFVGVSLSSPWYSERFFSWRIGASSARPSGAVIAVGSTSYSTSMRANASSASWTVFAATPGNRMALVEHLLARHERLAQVLVLPVLREVGGGRHRPHARMRLRLARVDGLDDRVRVRTPKYLPAQQPRRVLVGTVLCDARHLVRPVVADGTLADGLELHLG